MIVSSRILPYRGLARVAGGQSFRSRAGAIRHNQTAGSVPRTTTNSQEQTAEAELAFQEGAPKGMPKHDLDYHAMTDYRTSHFSPTPIRVVDGSEPGSVAAAVVSGAPLDLQARTVRIYKPTKPATQSGTWHTTPWLMDWDPLPKGHRWENPLMGWQSTGDFMQGERVGFQSKEAAIAFAEKQGYQFFVQEPNVRRLKPKNYANNFVHSPKTLKLIFTK